METDEKRSGTDRSLCIVLKAIPYSEADYILTLFSRDQGLIDARAYGARSLKSEIRAACQPFCLAEFEFYLRNGRRSVRAAGILTEFFGIQSRFSNYACGCTALELTDKILHGVSNEEEYEQLFRLLAVFLKALNVFNGNPYYLLLFFYVRAVNLLGIFPSLDTCVLCGAPASESSAWSWAGGGAVCRSCAEDFECDKIDEDVRRCLASFGRRTPASEADLNWDLATVRSTLEAMKDMLKHHMGITVRATRLL